MDQTDATSSGGSRGRDEEHENGEEEQENREVTQG